MIVNYFNKWIHRFSVKNMSYFALWDEPFLQKRNKVSSKIRPCGTSEVTGRL